MIAPIRPEPPEPEGGGGELFSRPDNIRSDAKLAARMIALGVVSEEYIERLLRKGFRLAGKKAKAGDARGYSACMAVPIAVAKLGQTERHKMIPDQHQHTGAIDHNVRVTTKELLSEPKYVEYLRDSEANSDPRLTGPNDHKGNGKSLYDGDPYEGN